MEACLFILGAVGLIGHKFQNLKTWAANANASTVSFVVIGITILIYAYLARIKKRWLAIPLCSAIAGVITYAMGVSF